MSYHFSFIITFNCNVYTVVTNKYRPSLVTTSTTLTRPLTMIKSNELNRTSKYILISLNLTTYHDQIVQKVYSILNWIS